MGKYRKKPVVVEAYQITMEMLKSILFNNLPYPKGLFLGRAEYNKSDNRVYDWQGYVTTIHEQKTKVIMGDWIIAETDGEHFYPCKPDIFKETYEEVK